MGGLLSDFCRIQHSVTPFKVFEIKALSHRRYAENYRRFSLVRQT